MAIRHGTRTKTGEICNQTRKTLHQMAGGRNKEQASPVIQSKDTTFMQRHMMAQRKQIARLHGCMLSTQGRVGFSRELPSLECDQKYIPRGTRVPSLIEFKPCPKKKKTRIRMKKTKSRSGGDNLVAVSTWTTGPRWARHSFIHRKPGAPDFACHHGPFICSSSWSI